MGEVRGLTRWGIWHIKIRVTLQQCSRNKKRSGLGCCLYTFVKTSLDFDSHNALKLLDKRRGKRDALREKREQREVEERRAPKVTLKSGLWENKNKVALFRKWKALDGVRTAEVLTTEELNIWQWSSWISMNLLPADRNNQTRRQRVTGQARTERKRFELESCRRVTVHWHFVSVNRM